MLVLNALVASAYLLAPVPQRSGAPAQVAVHSHPRPAVSRAPAPAMFTLLTGNTLEAALKMQCDIAGASYAIYWSNVNGELVVAGDYTTDEARAANVKRGLVSSFAEQSEGFALDAGGGGPVATCFRENRQEYISNVADSTLTRADIAERYDINQIAFVPFEGGVLEYGTTRGVGSDRQWDRKGPPPVPTLPCAEMRKAYELLGSSYTMFWAKNADDNFVVVADHVTAARKLALSKVRSDDKTFCSESREYELDAMGDGPVATAARTGKELVVDDVSTMKRAAIAEEFGISKIVWLPVEGGVLEYGVPSSMYLESNLLEATLKLRAATSGAGYAMYWKEVNGQFTIAGDYISPARQLALVKAGREGQVR